MARKTPTLLAAGAALLAVTACTPPGGDPEDLRRTRTGAAAGGVLGAVTGALIASPGSELAGAAIGGVVGAGVGGAIGNMLDQQARELRQSLDSRVQIINNGNELIVRMPEGILFDFDSDALRPAVRRDLRELSASLVRYPGTTVEIIGHTDNVGTASYNRDLSQRRAEAVASVLVANGTPSTRITTYGRGFTDPIASNDTEQGRAQNRRVDIIIRPNA